MFCYKCGKKLDDLDRFCSVCGAGTSINPICRSQNRVIAQDSAPKKAQRKKLKWWHILLISIGVIYLYGNVIVSIVTLSDIANCYNDRDSGNTKKRDIEDYQYVEGNYYYCFPKLGGNQKYILKFSNMTETSITIEYFGHDLGLYGKDQYGHGFSTEEMYYSDSENCYKFEFCGHWKIYRGGVMYDRQAGGEQQNFEYESARPIDPADYWWFEKAQLEPVE